MHINQNINKSIEELENDYWKSPLYFPTELVKQIFLLRKKKIISLTSNEIRLLVSQNVGLKYLVPISLKILERNILEESLYFPGDLLISVLRINNTYWNENIQIKKLFVNLIINKLSDIKMSFEETDEGESEKINLIEDFIRTNTN